MSAFDSSDEESETIDNSEFLFDLSQYKCLGSLALSGLPGCRFKNTWRNIDRDIETLMKTSITDVFLLCTKGELTKYRVSNLISKYEEKGFNVHHYPFSDGTTPEMPSLLKMIDEIMDKLRTGDKLLVHCFGGLGRSGLVAACTFLTIDEQMKPEQAIEWVRNIRGARAIQTVKQFNFVNEFRELKKILRSS